MQHSIVALKSHQLAGFDDGCFDGFGGRCGGCRRQRVDVSEFGVAWNASARPWALTGSSLKERAPGTETQLSSISTSGRVDARAMISSRRSAGAIGVICWWG